MRRGREGFGVCQLIHGPMYGVEINVCNWFAANGLEHTCSGLNIHVLVCCIRRHESMPTYPLACGHANLLCIVVDSRLPWLLHVSPAHPAHPSIHPAHPCSPSIPSIQPSPVQPVRHARHRTMRTIVPLVSCCAIIRAIVNRPCIARIAANVFEHTCLLAEPSLTSMITRVLKGANLNAIC